MFMNYGWSEVKNPHDANLIQFTGGSDVDPSYYKEEKHATTWSSPMRDAQEAHIFNSFKGTPMAGICRGGQFLNVMNGGSMWQDVNNHVGGHQMRVGNEVINVTSTHHQMMRPSPDGHVVGIANLSTRRETATEVNHDFPYDDTEIVVYGNNLCFQPHPEYKSSDHNMTDLYFKLLGEIV
jgi:gamma-glutamyl-gamma-aminobutyrate hydrolase PuuD